jgi:predicted DNA-binding transcriptional regulator YafY
LEAAGYPVYYDQEFSGYRLANRSARAQQFTQVEAALLIIALGMIEGALTADSLSIIQRIRVKLEASIPYFEQRNLGLHLDSQLFRTNNGQIRDQILLSLIDLAKRMGKRLRLVHSELNSTTTRISEIDPNLRFERGWLIDNSGTERDLASIPISSILDLEMI